MSEQNQPDSIDLKDLIHDVVKSLPPNPAEQDLQGCAFDMRRALITKALSNIKDQESISDNQASMQELEHYEDVLRKSLMPMQSPKLMRVPKPSPWQNALLAVLGLLFGSAIGQGLMGVPNLAFGSGVVVICGVLGVAGILWFTDYILRASRKGEITLPWGTYRYVRARKASYVIWFALLALAILRDFFAGRIALLHFLESIDEFISTGNVLGIFTNVYGLLLFVGSIGLLIKRPSIFDKEDFAQKLEVATVNWWNGAQLSAKLLLENDILKNSKERERWQQVGRDIFSFAAELPSAQKQWLTERLHRLGLNTLQEGKKLTWHQDMLEHYIPLGHLDAGDACFVDEPPILEDGVVVRKGTVRKVR